jgi:hypothetical protein
VHSFWATAAVVAYLGWGIATSPLPIAGLAVMLLSDRARTTAWAFTATWLACQVVAVTAFALLGGLLAGIDLTSRVKHDIGLAMLVTGALMVLGGCWVLIRQRRHPSPRAGQHTRAFLDRAAAAGPRSAASMAIGTALVNPTNLPYWAGMALVIQRARVGAPEEAALVALGAVFASLTFIVISSLVVVLGHRLDRPLDWARRELVRHSSSVVPGFLITSGAILGLLAASDLGWL